MDTKETGQVALVGAALLLAPAITHTYEPAAVCTVQPGKVSACPEKPSAPEVILPDDPGTVTLSLATSLTFQATTQINVTPQFVDNVPVAVFPPVIDGPDDDGMVTLMLPTGVTATVSDA